MYDFLGSRDEDRVDINNHIWNLTHCFHCAIMKLIAAWEKHRKQNPYQTFIIFTLLSPGQQNTFLPTQKKKILLLSDMDYFKAIGLWA